MEKVRDGWRSLELYPCKDRCFPGDKEVYVERQGLRCALPGFPRTAWLPTSAGLHMGALEDPQDTTNPLEPPETFDEGCPGAWYRCRFGRSLMSYERTNTEGALSSNPMLDRCEDPLVLEAERYLQIERARSRAHDSRRMNAR